MDATGAQEKKLNTIALLKLPTYKQTERMSPYKKSYSHFYCIAIRASQRDLFMSIYYC